MPVLWFRARTATACCARRCAAWTKAPRTSGRQNSCSADLEPLLHKLQLKLMIIMQEVPAHHVLEHKQRCILNSRNSSTAAMNSLMAFSVLFQAMATHAARFCSDRDTFPLTFLALPCPGLDYVCHASWLPSQAGPEPDCLIGSCVNLLSAKQQLKRASNNYYSKQRKSFKPRQPLVCAAESLLHLPLLVLWRLLTTACS
jgi:hypothetical protein